MNADKNINRLLNLLIKQPAYLVSLVLLIAPLLFSCASSSEPKKHIVINITASSSLNPDINGRASPAVVSIYQLSNSANFRKSDYMSLVDNAQLALDKELLALHRVTVAPGQVISLEYPVSKDEKSFGIVVGYRVIDTSGWQLIYEYPPDKTGFWTRFGGKKIASYSIRLDKNKIQLESLPQKN